MTEIRLTGRRKRSLDMSKPHWLGLYSTAMNCTSPAHHHKYNKLDGLTNFSEAPTLALLSPSETVLSLSGTRRSSGRLLKTKSGSTVHETLPEANQGNTLTRLADLSLEFLMGRALDNAMLNVGLKGAAKGAFSV